MPNALINLRRRLQRGMTFIELIVSIVIVGIAASGVLLVMSMTTGRSADPMLREQAILIAESYMEEILAQKFYDPNSATFAVCPVPETGKRSQYDNVCDYHNLADNGCNSALGGACDRQGNIIAGLEKYNISVTVDSSSLSLGPSVNAYASPVDNTGALRVLFVTVRVTHDDFPDIDVPLSAYRTNYECGADPAAKESKCQQ